MKHPQITQITQIQKAEGRRQTAVGRKQRKLSLLLVPCFLLCVICVICGYIRGNPYIEPSLTVGLLPRDMHGENADSKGRRQKAEGRRQKAEGRSRRKLSLLLLPCFLLCVICVICGYIRGNPYIEPSLTLGLLPRSLSSSANASIEEPAAPGTACRAPTPSMTLGLLASTADW
jgi:hypothetical protein